MPNTIESITESAAEVAALIPRYSWELMDEDQRDALMGGVVLPRYMKTTTDDIQMTPTWWGKLLGATAESIRSRVKRLKASEIPDDGSRARAVDPRSARHAKSALSKDPGAVIDRLSSDERDQVREEIYRAEEREHAADPREPQRKRHMRALDMETGARQMIERAFGNLSARVNYYGDVPLNESDRDKLRWSRQMIDRLLDGAELDAELEAMLNE